MPITFAGNPVPSDLDTRYISRLSDEVWVADDFNFGTTAGWDFGSSGTGASNTLGITSSNDHPGIRVLVAGQGAGWSRIRVRGNAFVSCINQRFELVSIFRLDTTANTWALWGGNTSILEYGGFPMLRYSSSVGANWQVSGGNASVFVDTGVAATTNWIFCRMWRYATSGNINWEIRNSRTGTVLGTGTVTDGLISGIQDYGFVVKVPDGVAAANPGMTVDYVSARVWDIVR